MLEVIHQKFGLPVDSRRSVFFFYHHRFGISSNSCNVSSSSLHLRRLLRSFVVCSAECTTNDENVNVHAYTEGGERQAEHKAHASLGQVG